MKIIQSLLEDYHKNVKNLLKILTFVFISQLIILKGVLND